MTQSNSPSPALPPIGPCSGCGAEIADGESYLTTRVGIRRHSECPPAASQRTTPPPDWSPKCPTCEREFRRIGVCTWQNRCGCLDRPDFPGCYVEGAEPKRADSLPAILPVPGIDSERDIEAFNAGYATGQQHERERADSPPETPPTCTECGKSREGSIYNTVCDSCGDKAMRAVIRAADSRAGTPTTTAPEPPFWTRCKCGHAKDVHAGDLACAFYIGNGNHCPCKKFEAGGEGAATDPLEHQIAMVIQAALMLDTAKAAELDAEYIAHLATDLQSRKDRIMNGLNALRSRVESAEASASGHWKLLYEDQRRELELMTRERNDARSRAIEFERQRDEALLDRAAMVGGQVRFAQGLWWHGVRQSFSTADEAFAAYRLSLKEPT